MNSKQISCGTRNRKSFEIRYVGKNWRQKGLKKMRDRSERQISIRVIMGSKMENYTFFEGHIIVQILLLIYYSETFKSSTLFNSDLHSKEQTQNKTEIDIGISNIPH